jgi:hypothetical protein
MEKMFGKLPDKGAPPAGKMKLSLFGDLSDHVTFADGSRSKSDVNSIFTSPYVKGLIDAHNKYYIDGKGYRAFTSRDEQTYKLDLAQSIRKFLTWNDKESKSKLEIKIIGGAGIWGVFSKLAEVLGEVANKVKAGQANSQNSMWTFTPPYCICYITPDNRRFIKRILYVGYLTKAIGLKQYKKSGGKEIGTVEQ